VSAITKTNIIQFTVGPAVAGGLFGPADFLFSTVAPYSVEETSEEPDETVQSTKPAAADPDDLEEEIEAAADDGDFEPTHPSHRPSKTKTLPGKRKR
jgi:hypothetical protein